jgi:hypothetical protein
LEQNIPGQRQGVSAALAAAQARAAMTAPVRFPGEDGGRSLAEMAQRDLDAALHLLADRAQYITGASGAAIALRRDGRADMLCRASVGSNAPELGALLSTEFGLSGESVRTRQLLRCDDAERDTRVNRDACRQMGISSVVVMPVVNDDQVLGVFELFSGRANAFGERDLTAVQRLSEMVEAAVRLAHATETLPEQLSQRESSIAEAIHPEVFEGQFLGDLVVEDDIPLREVQSVDTIAAAALESPVSQGIPPTMEVTSTAKSPEPQVRAAAPVQGGYTPPLTPIAAKKPLFWSAAPNDAEAARTGEANQSHVPPVLRGLRKCEACGFPISAGRVLCVECEEKKWRGQLRPRVSDRKSSTGAASFAASRPTAGTFAAAAPSMAKAQQALGDSASATPTVAATSGIQSEESEHAPAALAGLENSLRSTAAPELVLSAGLEPPRSWFSANKYILIALAAIGATVVAFLVFR